jgi:pimeloyl-ACP methyl ester carboxylesterase
MLQVARTAMRPTQSCTAGRGLNHATLRNRWSTLDFCSLAMYLSRMATTNNSTASTQYLSRPEGRIAYDVAGEGPLAVLVPGMGDLRATYRFLAPAMVAAGYRVATTDLRGHGDSDATFSAYGDVETAGDLVSLIETLGGPAVLVGNSMGAGAAAYVAAERPDLVSALVLVGPFVRDGSISAFTRIMMRVALATPWAALSWKSYAPKFYAGHRPDDLDTYLSPVIASIKRPGYSKAFSLTTRTSHAPVEARLAEVTAPTLVVMGEKDPDFPDPKAEADWIAATLHGTAVMVPESGHYPQSQQPELVASAIVSFLTEAGVRG